MTEAAVSAILVATLSSTPEVRLLDVLIGGGVALAVNTFVFPPHPVVGVARATDAVFGELGAVLRDTAGALAAGDLRRGEAAADAAEHVETRVGELRRAVVTRQRHRPLGTAAALDADRAGAVRPHRGPR